jgi:hypothetical protein
MGFDRAATPVCIKGWVAVMRTASPHEPYFDCAQQIMGDRNTLAT